MRPRFTVPLTLLLLWSGKLLARVPGTLLTPALVTYAGLLLVWVTILGARSWSGVPMGAWRTRAIPVGASAGLLALVAGSAGYVLDQRLLGLEPPPEAASIGGSPTRLVAGLAFVLAAATLEEWIFRGALLDALGPLPRWAAALLTAAAFAAYHLSLFQLIPTFILGLVLAAVALKSRSVWTAVVAHGVFNAVGVILTASGLAAR